MANGQRKTSYGIALTSWNQEFYKPSDNIVVLNMTNLKSVVYGSEHAWLVQFYNSRSPICKLYSPTWRSLYHDIRPWQDIVKLAVVDCADSENASLRREYGFERYPELRYFGPNENPENLGTVVELGKDLYELRRNLVERLREEQRQGRGGKWPNLAPLVDLDELGGICSSKTVKYLSLLFDEPESFVPSEVILDLHGIECLAVRQVNSDNCPLREYHGVKEIPAITFYDCNGEPTNNYVSTREDTRDAIEQMIDRIGVDYIDFPEIPNDVYMDEWLKIGKLARSIGYDDT